MQKLKLNKKTVSSLNATEMSTIKGGTEIKVLGLSISSCKRGTTLHKDCCYN